MTSNIIQFRLIFKIFYYATVRYNYNYVLYFFVLIKISKRVGTETKKCKKGRSSSHSRTPLIISTPHLGLQILRQDRLSRIKLVFFQH